MFSCRCPAACPAPRALRTPAPPSRPEDVAEAMAWPNIIGLGEMMNFPGVVNNDPKMLAEIAATSGPARSWAATMPRPTSAIAFHAYAAGGPADDHEGTRVEDAIARVRQGMRAMLRLGSAWYDVAAQIKAVTETRPRLPQFHPVHGRLPFRHAGLRGPHEPRRAPRHRRKACEPLTAIQMATLNTAQPFRPRARTGLDHAGPPGRPHSHLRPRHPADRDW